jgi:galactokinase
MKSDQLKFELEKRFGNSDEAISCYFSPGRVNLIGEHTDYNGGYVFPCALSFGTYLAIRKNNLSQFRFSSGNMSFYNTVNISESDKKIGKEWVNYPLGVINQFAGAGKKQVGLDFYFFGDIPSGAGLSSSASIEMVTAFAMNDLLGFGYERIELIKISQKAENVFVGVNCGIMDQFASGMGKKDCAIFLDCNSLNYELVPIVLKNYKIVIANTNKRRGLADSKYNERRGECDTAVEYISKKRPIRFLGDLSLDDFLKLQNTIPDEIIRRRAMHVVSENERVIEAVKQLKEGNIMSFGELMNASHDSLRDDYEVTGTELDTLVSEAREIDGVIGSRMTGAGFGGCTVSLVDQSSIPEFISTVGKAYLEKTGLKADFYVADVGEGSMKISDF